MGEAFDLSKNIPSFLDLQLFREIFKNTKFSDFSITTASKPGDNFTGAVFRVTLVTDCGNKQYIVKVPTSSRHETLHAYLSDEFVESIFKCEIRMYAEVLPDILELWRRAGYDDLWSPSSIYHSMTPNPIIVLEDVSPFGYKVYDSPIKDFDTSKKIAQRLAKFHAASYYLIHEKNRDFSNFTGSVFKIQLLSDVIYKMGLEGFIHVASQKPALSKYTEKLRRLHDEFEVKIEESYKPSVNGINVLCHNDFHLKNVLFKEDKEGKIEDFYAIDFQLCNFTSPAMDLSFALYYFLSEENRRNHRNDFISAYYNQFVASLKEFNFSHSIPSKEMLDKELYRCKEHEMLTAICLTIFYYFDLRTLTEEDLDLGEGTMKAKYRMFANEDFLKMIEWQLEEFETRGIL